MDDQNAGQVVDNLILVRDAQAGSHSAFAELITRYDRGALRLALHLTGSEADAQDICQEAFLRAYRNIRTFRLECSFYTWLYRIVANLCMDYMRKMQLRNEHTLEIVDSHGEACDPLDRLPDSRSSANPEEELLRKRLGARIRCAMNRLSPRERIVFELRHFHDLRLQSIGEILKLREGVVKTTLFRGTQKVRKALSAERPHLDASPGNGSKNATYRERLATCLN